MNATTVIFSKKSAIYFILGVYLGISMRVWKLLWLYYVSVFKFLLLALLMNEHYDSDLW